MANKTIKLSVCTYNVRGYDSTKHGYIIELLNKCTILVIEEHWLNDQQLSNFGNLFSGYCEPRTEFGGLRTITRTTERWRACDISGLFW